MSAQAVELETAKAELETLRAQTAAATVNSEQAFHRLEQDHLQLKQRNEKVREELRALRHEVGNADKQRVVSDASAANLKGVLATKEAEMERQQREARVLKEERDGLLSRTTRLLEESKDRNAEMQSYATRLEESYKLRHDLQDKVEELQGAARTSQFELHRTKEEKDAGDKHSAWLTEELEIKQKELTQLRTERTDSTRELQQKADDSAEEAAKLAGQVGVLRARADDAEQKTRQLEVQLQGRSSAMQEQEEHFKSDLAAREQLEKLLKDGMSDAELKLKQVTDAAKMLQERIVNQDRQHAEEQEGMSQKYTGLEQQLKAAQAEATKSAAAPAAQLALPSKPVAQIVAPKVATDPTGVRISDLMGEKIAVENELRECKLENKRLNNYLNSILVELEAKAPLINEQREAYEKAIRSHARITQQLDDAKQDAQNAKALQQQTQQGLEATQRTKSVLETTNAEMGLQIQKLEGARVISGSGGNIPTLQKQNEQLLRENAELKTDLKKSQETAETAATADRQNMLALALQDVEEMRTARARQEEMVGAIVHQRDVYRELLQSGGQSAGVAQTQLAETAVGGSQQLRALQKEFDIYKEEQTGAFKMLEAKLEQVKENDLGAQTKLASSQVKLEHEQQRYSRLQEVLQSKKDELGSLDAKHAEFKASIKALQQKLEAAQAAMTASAETQRRKDSEGARMKTEHDVAKLSEKRLLGERESLKTEKRTQDKLIDALQQAVSEKEALITAAAKRQQDTDTRHDSAVQALKEAEEAQRQKAAAAVEQLRGVEQELAASKTAATVSTEQAKIARDMQLDAEQKLAEAQSAAPAPAVPAARAASPRSLDPAPAAAAGADSADSVEAERREAQLKLITLEDELASVKESVAAKEKAAADYAAIARGHEQTMDLQRQEHSDAVATAERLAAEIETEQKEVARLRANLENAGSAAVEARKDVEAERDGARAELTQQKAVIEQLKSDAGSATATAEALKADAENHHGQWREARNERLSELQKHSKTAEELQAVQNSVEAVELKYVEAQKAADAAKAESKTVTETAAAELGGIQKRLDATVEELAESRKTSETLRVQLEKSAESFRFGQPAGGGGGAQLSDNAIMTSPVGKSATAAAGGEAAAAGNSSALFEVSAQLRRELEIRKADGKVLEEKMKRVTSQSEHLQRELDLARAKLSEEMQRSSRIDMSPAELEALASKASQYDVLKDSNVLLRQETETRTAKVTALQDEVAAGVKKIESLEREKGAIQASLRSKRSVKTMNFVLKTRNCVSKTRNCVFKMMNFAAPRSRLERRRLRNGVRRRSRSWTSTSVWIWTSTRRCRRRSVFCACRRTKPTT